MPSAGEPLVIPLWVDGHAYLTMAGRFFDVRSPKTGEILRRTPLCGAREAARAVVAAHDAQPQWSSQVNTTRARLLVAIGKALAGYAGHFSRLIAEETGWEDDVAAAEVAHAVALLCGTETETPVVEGKVVAIVSDDSAPLYGPLSRAVPALLAGATVVLKPSPKVPSAIFALAELAVRTGLPCGVLNILHGDEVAIESLCALSDVSLVLFAGDARQGGLVGATAARHGKPFAS